MSTINDQTEIQSATLFGHPTGLFTLFFAEMWERFSYYGMRALLVFYMIKGFLGYNDNDAYAVYAAYGALVYAAPFIGGMIADQLLGARRAVIFGGLLMAAGHILMTVKNETAFFMALALLICGNGFFKPNISTIVGGLYPEGSPKKDAGFTIFYMGINLGAAMSPVVCGYVGETYGWHYGFGLATAGMLIGVAIFAAPTLLTQAFILVGALGSAFAMPFFQDTMLQLVVRLILSAALAASGIIAVIALGRGGIPEGAGAPRDPSALKRKLGGILRADWAIYLGVLISVPLVSLVVRNDPVARAVLLITGACALAFIAYEALFRSNKIERERLCVALVLMFFSMLFWAFFEQAGSSVNNFTDRNIDRVIGDKPLKEDKVGTNMKLRVPPRKDNSERDDLTLLSQEQLGMECGPDVIARVHAAKARQKERAEREKPKEDEKEEETDDTKKLPNDRPVSISVSPSPPSAREDSGSTLAFTLSVEQPVKKPMAVKFKVAGTSTPKEDYNFAGMKLLKDSVGTAIIRAGESSTTVKITPKADKSVEWNETVILNTGSDEATATIEDVNYVLTASHLSVLRDEALRDEAKDEDKTVNWPVEKSHVDKGMRVGGAEIPASEFQAANPMFIVVFGLVFTALWSFLGTRGLEPSTTVKFALGLLQLGLAFGAFWYGAQMADERGMVSMYWLLLGYLLQTTGELCLSPVGLSMVTNLSPKRIVSSVMGAWFLATAFSNYLAGMIAKLTGVKEGLGEQMIPPPSETVNLYGDVFGQIAIAAIVSAVICFMLSPLLTRWMHLDEDADAYDEDEYAIDGIDGNEAD